MRGAQRALSGQACLALLAGLFLSPSLKAETPVPIHWVEPAGLIGQKVTNLDGEELGLIVDLVVDLEQGYVAFAEVSLDPFDGQPRYAVPLEALQVVVEAGQIRRILLPRNRQQVVAAAKFAEPPADKTAVNSARLARAAESFSLLGYRPYWVHLYCLPAPVVVRPANAEPPDAIPADAAPVALEPLPAIFRPVGQILGQEVKTPSGDLVGRIDKLLVDAHTGVIPFVVLQADGKRRPVPLQRIGPRPNVETLVYDAPVLVDTVAPLLIETWPPVPDAVWLESLYAYYGLPPTLYLARRPWLGEHVDLYTRLWNPATVITVRGPVLGLNRAIPLPGDRTGVMARIKIGGEFPLVYLGSSDYLHEHEFPLGIAEWIEVTGSKTVIDGRVVIIASAVRNGPARLELRDSYGLSLWCAAPVR